ncbi:netrin 4 precursor [Saccoglossus kowalevskii]|uniref:Netrin-1 n=1 Tax=Saccoglossus kowalevskii TaxID=10224 RepID=D2XNH7_SACKO|nr:netrin 4 precursor [Saccoglossus kowalevskii]ADB22607.1 netrin4 [Saccoglossus kowalevskii]
MSKYWFLIVFLVCCLATSALTIDIDGVGCSQQTCYARTGNLVIGRQLKTLSECGKDRGEKFCVLESCDNIECYKCNTKKASKAHPASHMIDSSLTQLDTWWQSSLGVTPETIQLDFEGHFYFTYLVMVFKNARPAAMVIERSDDFAQTWRKYAYYSNNCTAQFGMAEDDDVDSDGAVCTSRYSQIQPCSNGEVIFRSLLPTRGRFDPYGMEAQDRMKITNLRIKLLKSQRCIPCQAEINSMEYKLSKMDYFAVSNVIVGGTCFCNGHASECVPLSVESSDNQPPNKVHGKCVCQHNTDGDDCEQCLPLFNDAPWRPANGLTGEPNQCKQCECNGHADSCHFDSKLWDSTNYVTGGVCDSCKHHTTGTNCQLCESGYYRDSTKEFTAANACKRCRCDPTGTSNRPCDEASGICFCKKGVAEPLCDMCLPGYYGFGRNGCRECTCGEGIGCDANTGACPKTTRRNRKNNRDTSRNSKRRERQFRLSVGYDGCDCPEQQLGDIDLCQFDYVLRAKILSADDKGSQVVVNGNIKRVLATRGDAELTEGAIRLYPISWTEIGCTCPLLKMDHDYLIAGKWDSLTGRLLIDQRSVVIHWDRNVGREATEFFEKKCL